MTVMVRPTRWWPDLGVLVLPVGADVSGTVRPSPVIVGEQRHCPIADVWAINPCSCEPDEPTRLAGLWSLDSVRTLPVVEPETTGVPFPLIEADPNYGTTLWWGVDYYGEADEQPLDGKPWAQSLVPGDTVVMGTTRLLDEPVTEMTDPDDDYESCPYWRSQNVEGADPSGTCDRGCYSEPACMTSRWPVPLDLPLDVVVER